MMRSLHPEKIKICHAWLAKDRAFCFREGICHADWALGYPLKICDARAYMPDDLAHAKTA